MVKQLLLNNSKLESRILASKHSKERGFISAIGVFYAIVPYIFLSLTLEQAPHRQLQDGAVINKHLQDLIKPNPQPTNIGEHRSMG